MQRESREFLEAFLATNTPSGFESEGQVLWRERTGRFVDSVRSDVHGNIIAAINGDAPTRVMLAGHCDEIGLMATYVDENGFIFFGAIGGVDAAALPGMRVRFLGRRGVTGVIGRKPIHLTEKEERDKGVDIKGMWVDIGATSRKEALKYVKVGDAACVVSEHQVLLNDRIASKAWDDKAGAFVVSEALRLINEDRKRLQVSVYGVSTVQEEVGLRGAMTSGYGIEPHAAIAIDVGHATDAPTVDKKVAGEVALDGGPCLHRGPNSNVVLGRMMEKAAKRRKIPVQWVAEPRISGTDADALQVNRGGVATALVSIPNRYMHTPVEICSLKDIEKAAELVAETVLAMPPAPDFKPY
jgi:tetrahedral aminopeptidase